MCDPGRPTNLGRLRGSHALGSFGLPVQQTCHVLPAHPHNTAGAKQREPQSGHLGSRGSTQGTSTFLGKGGQGGGAAKAQGPSGLGAKDKAENLAPSCIWMYLSINCPMSSVEGAMCVKIPFAFSQFPEVWQGFGNRLANFNMQMFYFMCLYRSYCIQRKQQWFVPLFMHLYFEKCEEKA